MNPIGNPGLPRRSAAILLAAFGLLLPRTARAAGLPAPTEKSILTVSGKISVHNDGQTASFDRPMLEAIGDWSFETRTPWYDGEDRFEGVAMSRLMEAVGASGDRVAAIAVDDYLTEIPISDFTRFDVMLALKRDGKYLTIRDNGPLFIVYPFDKYPELRSSTYTSWCAWQVTRLIVK